ncbi:MAG TPA: SUMF1/EgtB/PvdO family nonheme iron enzyme [Anaerolineae bacterium]|nr:SUMF1/EgtB/PvdO family nonheme iron enzyme [Anaerolineae bacterium]
MNLDQWKEAAQRNLQRLAQRIGQLAPGTVYGALCSASLLPVVTAAQQGDFAALVALGSVVGSVGGNLIANQIQGWHDRSEEELAAELGQRAAADPQWLETLDALLTQLEAPQMVQASLNEQDWSRLAEVLEKELTRLGSRVSVEIKGSGSAAVDHSAAAGPFGIAINGNVANSLVQVYVQRAAQPEPVDYRAALERYLNHLLETRQVLNLHGIPSFRPIGAELEKAYVALRALDPARTERLIGRYFGRQRSEAVQQMLAEQREDPVPLQQLLARHGRLVVLGDPGSGKTTFLAYLTLSAARVIAQDDPALLAERLGMSGAAPLPVVLPLREFGRYLRIPLDRQRMGEQPQLLLDYLNECYRGWNLDLPGDFFTHHLDAGRCLVMLDGLDEVADFDERILVREQVEAFVQRYGSYGNRFVLTCRVRGYEGEARLGQNFTICTILPFVQDDIERFVQSWCLAEAAFEAQSAQQSVRLIADQKAHYLLKNILTNAKIKELASNPLLLTIIALVNGPRSKLPERRSELYKECTDVLLGYFEQAKPGKEGKRLARYTGVSLEMDAGEKRAFLEPVALAMHESLHSEWERDRLATALAVQFCERGEDEPAARQMARTFLETLMVRSGLVQEVEQGVYGFLHLSFQEYLAARKIADSPDYIATTLSHLDDTWWREVILLEAGHLSESGRTRVSQLVEAILDAPGDAFERLLLAASCLADVGSAKAEAGLWRRVERELMASMAGNLPARRRAEAGRGLARLGDSRESVTTVEHMPFCLVPGGPFWMGEDKEQHRCEAAPADFWINRYPVTNAQYKLFVQAGGYSHDSYWSEAKRAGFWRPGEFKGNDDSVWCSGPVEFREPFGLPNHPVVGLTWYEALAFTRWLTEHLHRKQLLAPGWAIRLPSEAEWEKAARGGWLAPAEAVIRSSAQGFEAIVPLVTNPDDNRAYPWLGKIDPERANYGVSRIGSTNAVGCFPGGASACGAEEMSGNVWEWTRSVYDEYPYPASGMELQQREDLAAGDSRNRVLRGASFNFEGISLRCAARLRFNPYVRGVVIGFRVCASP